MSYVRWIASAPLSLAMNILTFILAPFLAALSVAIGRNTLPGPLAWFHTYDDTLDGGQRQLDWPKAKGLELWKQRTAWMWRNPSSGFDTVVLGIRRGEVVYSEKRGSVGKSGFLQRGYIEVDGRQYFFRRTNRYWIGWHQFGPGDGPHKFQLSLRRD